MNLVSALRRAAGAVVLLGLMASVSPARAQGDLLVAPTRVIINGAGNAEVVLSNIGDKPATYRISLELRRMEESGDFSEVDETAATESERTARDMVRFAPRRVTLLPGQPQAVRLSVRPPEGLPDGEYRVHMSFRAIPAAQLAETAEEAAIPASGVSIKLTPIYGITIPVFVRQGRLEAQAAIAGARLVRSEKQSLLEVDMTRTGKRSVYGELIGRNSRGEVVFSLRGIAIYPEVDRRKVHVRLNSEQIGKIQGPLKLEYRDLPENGGALLAEATVTVS